MPIKRNSMNKSEILKGFNKKSANTLMETLGIEYTDVGEDFLTAKMPVNSRVHQPYGQLHGGATAALAESAVGYTTLSATLALRLHSSCKYTVIHWSKCWI